MPKHRIKRNPVGPLADPKILDDKIYSMKLVFDEFPGINNTINRDDAINSWGGVHKDPMGNMSRKVMEIASAQYEKLGIKYPTCASEYPKGYVAAVGIPGNQDMSARHVLREFLKAEKRCILKEYPKIQYDDSADLLGLNSPATASSTSTSSREKELEGLFPPQTREEEMKGLFDSSKAGKRRRSKKRVTKKRRNGKKTIKRKH